MSEEKRMDPIWFRCKSLNPMRIIKIAYDGRNGHRYEREFEHPSDFTEFIKKKGITNMTYISITTASGQQYELCGGYWNIPLHTSPDRVFHEIHSNGVVGWERECSGYRQIWPKYGSPIGVWC